MALVSKLQDRHEFRRVRIQEARLTQTELADCLNLTQQTISRYERGVFEIPVFVGLALEALAGRSRRAVREEMGWAIVNRRAEWQKVKRYVANSTDMRGVLESSRS